MVSYGSRYARVGPGSLNDQKWHSLSIVVLESPWKGDFKKPLKEKKIYQPPPTFYPNQKLVPGPKSQSPRHTLFLIYFIIEVQGYMELLNLG